MKKKIGIIGAGRLGTNLAAALKEKGLLVSGVSCQDYAESLSVAKRIGVHAFKDNYELAQSSDVIFVTVPDTLIITVAEDIVRHGLAEGKIMLHCSGTMSGFVLPCSPNLLRGSFHPLQSFASAGVDFAGIYIAMDGDNEAVNFMRELCKVLDTKPLAIPPAERPLYHAAAVFASNYLVSVLSIAESLFSKWADNEADARAAFMPLVNGTIANFVNLGAPKALTGPIARGDNHTLQHHLQALPEDYLDIYKQLGLFTLTLANKNLTDEQIAQIKRILKGE